MAGIICAIRGGPASQPTIDHAISLAKKTNFPLYFLYVVNLDFLSFTTSIRIHVMAQEMQQLGEFILLSAKASAATQKIDAQGIVRHGSVMEEIINLCHELAADYVVLGHPKVRREESVFTRDLLAEFTAKIERVTGAKVEVVQCERRMIKKTYFGIFITFLVLAVVVLEIPWKTVPVQAATPAPLVTGSVFDHQGQPVADARVWIASELASNPLVETNTQPDGRYTLVMPDVISDQLTLHIERAHFQSVNIPMSSVEIKDLRSSQTVILPDTTLIHRINFAFWLAAGIFVLVLVLIATGWLHNTLSALVGVALIFAFSYLGNSISSDLFIFDFKSALGYEDWNVIFLIMGMMIIIAVVERTGIFQWLAFKAYRISGGRIWLLIIILMVLTGIASALLDNVTTMLLMTPISVQIALALGLNPLALLMPEVMASNVAGISTLIGTPTNILIGSYGKISFNSFLANLTPGVVFGSGGVNYL